MVALLLLWSALPTFTAGVQLAPRRRTAYPIYMIGSSNMHHCVNQSCLKSNITDTDADALSVFTFIEGSFDPAEIALVRSKNKAASPDFTLYVESGTTHGPFRGVPGYPEGLPGFEQGGFRSDARFYLQGNLTSAPLRPHDTTLCVCPTIKYRGRFPTPLPASTAPGNTSEEGHGFVSFVRIGSELLKVTATHTDPHNVTCQQLTVQRGLDGTAVPSVHEVGAPVLAPAYANAPVPAAGSAAAKRWTPIYHPRYNSTWGVDSYVNWTLYAMAQGYSGSWLDSFHPQPQTGVRDAGGHVMNEWNLRSGGLMTFPTCMQQQRARLTRIWAGLKHILGHYPILLANDGGQWEPGLVTVTPGYRPLDGLCLEAWGGGTQNTAGPNCWNHDPVPAHWAVVWRDEAHWKRQVERIMEAAQAKVRAFPTIGQAGCVASAVEAMPERDQFEQYTYASFLLAVEDPDPARGPHLGIAGYYVSSDIPGGAANRRVAHVHPRFFYDIGTPTHTQHCHSLDPAGGVWKPQWACNASGYKVSGHRSYLRHYVKGVVVVNPSNASDKAVPLGGGTYVHPGAGAGLPVTSVDVAPHSGLILLVHRSDDVGHG